jgi:sodium transport system permease protein
VAGVAVVFVIGGVALEAALGEMGIFVAEWLLLLGPSLLFVALGGFDARRTLSLGLPSAAGWAAALLMAAGALPVAWLIGWLQTRVLPVPADTVNALERLVSAHTPARIAWTLLLVALTPAVCEEAVFRGVLLGGTRSLTPWRVVVLNGVVFGAFHLSLDTPIRFLPTAWLGIVMAWTVLRTRSVWTGVLMHFLNNGTIVLLASVPVLQGTLTDPDAPPPVWLIPLAVLCLAAGLHMLDRPARSTEPNEDNAVHPTSEER